MDDEVYQTDNAPSEVEPESGAVESESEVGQAPADAVQTVLIDSTQWDAFRADLAVMTGFSFLSSVLLAVLAGCILAGIFVKGVQRG